MRDDERVETSGSQIGAKTRKASSVHVSVCWSGLARVDNGGEESFECLDLTVGHTRDRGGGCRRCRELGQFERTGRIV